MRKLRSILVTGGAGFIGSNMIRFLLEGAPGFDGRVVCLDALTYAGNRENLSDIEREHGGKRFFFESADICDRGRVEAILAGYGIDTVLNFAAETHVDRSIAAPEAFVRTNVMGTFTLLDSARAYWRKPGGDLRDDVLFHQVGTDEVYGSVESGSCAETAPYDPRSPYSASKASGDHLALAYCRTYGLPTTLSNCSNNYGPRQFPEKLIPLMILGMLEGKALPVYGDGRNVRDWIYVEDHNRAVWAIAQRGRCGERYNIGGGNGWENLALLERLIAVVAGKAGLDEEALRASIAFVADRPGHDRRYAIDSSKLEGELGWKPALTFERGLELTVEWYLANRTWADRVRNGSYRGRAGN